MSNTSAGSVTTAPATFDTALPVDVLSPSASAVDDTVALFARPVVVAVTASPGLPFTQVFLSVRLRWTRVFVYVHTIGPSPGFTVSVEPDSPVVPVQTGPVDV